MTEIKNTKLNLESFNDIGKRDGEIKNKLEEIKNKDFSSCDIEVFLKETNGFTDDFQQYIEEKLDVIFSLYNLKSNDIITRKNKFLEDLRISLDLNLNKKILSQITLDSVQLYALIKGLSNMTDEVVIYIEKDHICIPFMDPSRIQLTKVIIKSENYKFFRTGAVGVNLDDFAKILNTSSSEKAMTTLVFGTEKIFLSVYSNKFKNTIDDELFLLDLDMEEVPLDNLLKIEYPFKIKISKEKFIHVLKKMGIHSEIIDFKVDQKKIEFYQTGQIGNRSVTFKKGTIKSLEFKGREIIERQLEIEQEKQILDEDLLELLKIRVTVLDHKYNRLAKIKYKDQNLIKSLEEKIELENAKHIFKEDIHKPLQEEISLLQKKLYKKENEYRTHEKKIDITDKLGFKDSLISEISNSFINLSEMLENKIANNRRSDLTKLISCIQELNKDQTKRLSHEDYDNSISEIESLNDEIDTLKSRINELNPQLPSFFKNIDYVEQWEQEIKREMFLTPLSEDRKITIKNKSSNIKDTISKLKDLKKKIKSESQNPKLIDSLKKSLDNPESHGSYSLTFLKAFGKLVDLLKNEESVTFYLKFDHPLKAKLKITLHDYTKKHTIGEFSLSNFLASRVEEEEYNNDYEDDDEF